MSPKSSIFVPQNKKIKKRDMTKEEFLTIAENYYTEFELLKEESTFYDYEKSFVNMMQKMSSDYMEKQLGEGTVTQDRRRKKKHLPVTGKLQY
jgi:hypothetical protein